MKSIATKPRDKSEDTDSLRENGRLPAVYYGKGTEAKSISVDQTDFEKLWFAVGGSTIFEIEDDNGDTNTALIQDVALHPVSDRPIHADFYVIEEGQTVTVDAPVVAAGDAPAVKNIGGLLVQTSRTLEVEAEPKNLPDELPVDVTDLEEFGDKATVSDIAQIEDAEIQAEPDEVLFLIEEPEELEEPEPGFEEEGPDFEDIEVEGETEKEPEAGEEGEESGDDTSQDAEESGDAETETA